MEEIQFFNYILSILAFLFAAWAAWNTLKQDDKTEWQIKDIRDQIRMLKEANDAKRK